MFPFVGPTTMSISGMTGSGKSTWVHKLLRDKEVMFEPKVIKVMYAYGIWQQMYERMEVEFPFIQFIQGLPTEEEVDEFADGDHHMIVIDDLMQSASKSPQVEFLFTRGSHHKLLSIVFINQNMYSQGKHSRTISLNTHYMVLFKNPRDVNQVKVLSRQIGLGKTLEESYNDCTAEPYGYLVIDLSPHTDSRYRLRSHIFPQEDTIMYTTK